MTGFLLKAGDWLARTAMLVLAALATLSLIGSLASVSNSPIGDAFPGQVAAPSDQRAAGPVSDPQIVDPATGATMTIESPDAGPIAAPPPAPEPEVTRWLKALTYAVIALAVFAAAGVIALVRVAGHLRRMSER